VDSERQALPPRRSISFITISLFASITTNGLVFGGSGL
jgi:hypothetical protein